MLLKARVSWGLWMPAPLAVQHSRMGTKQGFLSSSPSRQVGKGHSKRSVIPETSKQE